MGLSPHPENQNYWLHHWCSSCWFSWPTDRQ